MSKYKKAFDEVNLLMNEVLDKFNMTLEETIFILRKIYLE
ncbi:hypothetical protein VEE65_09740 [Escherichia coli]|uniref:Uncharacterized protein n=1 Tax=Escherichia coli TaxID=562 RepID=A0A2X7JX66_ECOLX|nr:hypothetical protein VEE65_09740 [Escherichia coli]SQP84374.1 Uncharacterised protein [Escherichia coli]SRY43487.1 Uncharacterised protein [Escherichia coli]